MSLVAFARLLVRRIRLLVSVPAVMALTVFVVTLGQPEEYASHTMLYTGIVSGASLDEDSPMKRNHLAIASAFDNLLSTISSRQTLEEVALRLLSEEIYGESDSPLALVSTGSSGDDFLAELTGETPGQTLENLRRAKDTPNHPVHDLLYTSGSPLSIGTLKAGLSAKRVASSDMIEIRYTSSDRDLCRRTLDVVLEVFISKYRVMKEQETGRVISYFEEATSGSHDRLRTAVTRLRDFGVDNRVINYHEQTKAIAFEKEQIDRDLQVERMRLSAAEAALEEIGQSLTRQDSLFVNRQLVLGRRQELAAVAVRRVAAEAAGARSATSAADDLESSLQGDLAELYRMSRTPEGVARPDLVDSWLTSMIEATESRTRVNMLETRFSEYQKVYDEFAPLGSTLSSLEREVDIAESEYLELLHSLNLARMRQQSVELSTNLNVVDPPYLPDTPLPSKRLLLVGLAFFIGVVFSTGGVVAVDRLDQSLRTPERASRITGYPVVAAYPVVGDEREADEDKVTALVSQHLARVVELHVSDGSSYGNVLVAGHLESDGASLVSSELSVASAAQGTTGPPSRVASAEALMRDPIGRSSFNPTDVVLLAVRAGRSWTTADRRMAAYVAEAHGRPPLIVLTGASEAAVEETVGDLPKKRSALREHAKRLLRFEFQA